MELISLGLGEHDEPTYTEEERQRDRAELIEQLRSQIESGEYKPSIGRISMNIFTDITGD
ncbi:flagellar biosynthesis anti-sigma factor FlgM [Desulfovibrio ferrophilus]|uniref:Anti-sigma-28 factor FlgM C-terminal domain-containing protein n=1 Tax=Desulfovibrio ferrophilus TaxID=241368 RepID=A0A2Z6AUS3_9BACT|nr:flagellar biosynthesis anti-sigma factor FlgM [Desulfovibrio ferrophilus]BBD06945.1 uncharacterized protein DFE_0219 [Desulfovibrio ferrophilus]